VNTQDGVGEPCSNSVDGLLCDRMLKAQ
jgi:hypothetical protein